MACPYEFYIPSETYYPHLYCKINDKICLYSKRCDKVYKFIPLDNQDECYYYNMEIRKDIPEGSYFVETYRATSNGKLYIYVEVDNVTEKILTNLTELNQNYIYLKKVEDKYEVSLNPFPIEIEKTTSTKTTTTKRKYTKNTSKSARDKNEE